MAGNTRDIAGYVGAQLIGRGGFGAVYRATDSAHGRDVAIKVLEGSLGDAERRRFDRERQTMGRLGAHPNIVPVYDSGYTEAGEGYIVMELATGGSLRDRLESSGQLPWKEATEIMASVASATQAAHDNGVLHRDIKPDNVLIDQFGNPKLSDFGIAAVASNATATTSTTATLAHAAPELLQGQPSTESVDIYALGSTLHALITGWPPFLRPDDEGVTPMITRALTEPPPDLRLYGVPDAVADSVARSMAKLPHERHGSAAELAAEFTAGASGAAPTAPNPATGFSSADTVVGIAPPGFTPSNQYPPATPPPGGFIPSNEYPAATPPPGGFDPSNQYPPATPPPGGFTPSNQYPPATPPPGGFTPSNEYPPATPPPGGFDPSNQYPPATPPPMHTPPPQGFVSPGYSNTPQPPAGYSTTPDPNYPSSAANPTQIGTPAPAPLSGQVPSGSFNTDNQWAAAPQQFTAEKESSTGRFVLIGVAIVVLLVGIGAAIAIVAGGGDDTAIDDTTTTTTTADTTTTPSTVATTPSTVAVVTPTVVIDCPTEMPLNVRTVCSIITTDATSGEWNLPTFLPAPEAIDVPGEYEIFVEPTNVAGVGQSFTITASATSSTGATVEASHDFTVVDGPRVEINCPDQIPLNSVTICEIVSSNAVEGDWEVPSFGSAILEVVPGTNPISIEPTSLVALGQRFTITATVRDNQGQSATASQDFLVTPAEN